MILDKVSNIKLYERLGIGLKRGLRFIAAIDKDILPGTYEIGKEIRAIVSEYQTKVSDDGVYEAHKKVIDIQYLIKGKELIKWAPLSSLLLASAYDPQKDISLHSATSDFSSFVLSDGVFAVFFPEDAHNPGLALDKKQEYVKKVVVKVAL